MVKVPSRAPDWQTTLAQSGKMAAEAIANPEVIALIRKANKRYFYWDELRSRPLEAPYGKELVWACLKSQREIQLKPLSLFDKEGLPFRYWLPDPLPGELHRIDRATERLIVENPGRGKQHLIRSLMEEAITSSQVEGAATTMRDAKQMLRSGRQPRNRSERMIFNNYETMQLLKEIAEDGLTPEVILEIHRKITHGTLPQEDQAGRYRRADEEVRIENNQGDILFEPPGAETIESEIDRLCTFANDSSLDVHPVVRAIILHFFLAYLHPFVDGNGRTARALFYWYLIREGYWYLEYLSISKIILKKLGQYGRAYLYTEWDDADLTYFLHFHLRIISAAIDDLQDYLTHEQEDAFTALENFPDLNMRQSRLILDLSRQPKKIITIKDHETQNGIVYQTARSDLLHLVELGLLKKIKKGKTFHFILAKPE